MKLKSIFAAALFAGSLGAAHAQDIPPLSDVIQNMDPAELQDIGAAGPGAAPITGDMDAVISTAVSDAIADGVISADQASDVTASLNIISSNAQFFDFDIVSLIGELMDPNSEEYNASLTPAMVRETLEKFNRLSDAGKRTVGKESFSYPEDIGQLSAPDQAIVGDMPVFQQDLVQACAANEITGPVCNGG